MAKTISFSKGKGSIRHNNRDFISDNIDKNRIKNNITYVQQPLTETYDELFGQALNDYNAKQKRADRKIENYMTHLKNSKNRESLFHEVVVQLGDQKDSGLGTKDFTVCSEVLDRYMKGFQQRNPHIHVFNAVLHLDEATPHLHISFVPVAKGYKTGLSVRNSISKAMESFKTDTHKLGILGWYAREREVLKECAQEKGIEITELGVDRKRLSVKEYKETKDEIKALKTVKNNLEMKIKEETQMKYTVQSEIKALQSDLKLIKEFDNQHTPKAHLGHVSVHEYEDLKQSALKHLTESLEMKSEIEKLEETVNDLKQENKYSQRQITRLEKENKQITIFNQELKQELNLYQNFILLTKLDKKFESNKDLLKKLIGIMTKPFEYTLEQFKDLTNKINKVFEVEIELDSEDMAKLKESPTQAEQEHEWDLDR